MMALLKVKALFLFILLFGIIGLTVGLWRLVHLPAREYGWSGAFVDFDSPHYCQFSPPRSEKGEEFFTWFTCGDFQFNAEENAFEFLWGPSNELLMPVLTELTLTPTGRKEKPVCWLDGERVSPENRYADPVGIYLRRLTTEEGRLIRNGSSHISKSLHYINVTLPCTDFNEEDIKEGIWAMNYTFYFIPHRTYRDVAAGNISERYRGEGEVVINKTLERQIAEAEKAITMIEVNRSERIRYISTYSGLAVLSLAIIAYTIRGLVLLQKKKSG